MLYSTLNSNKDVKDAVVITNKIIDEKEDNEGNEKKEHNKDGKEEKEEEGEMEVEVSTDAVTGKKTITMRKKGMLGRYKKYMFLLRMVSEQG